MILMFVNSTLSYLLVFYLRGYVDSESGSLSGGRVTKIGRKIK